MKVKPLYTLKFVARNIVCFSYVNPTSHNSLAAFSRGSTDGDSWQAVLLEDINAACVQVVKLTDSFYAA